MNRLSLIKLSSLSLLLLVGCGRSSSSLETLPLTAAQQSYVRRYANAPLPVVSASDTAQVKKVLQTIDDIKARIDALEGTGAPETEAALPEDVQTTASKTLGSESEASPSKQVATVPASTPKTENILKEISDYILSAPAIDAIAYQNEKGLDSGKTTENHLHFYKQGNLVKIEVLASSPRNAGVKVLYNVGSDKVKIRPAGALSFLTTELAQKDEKIASVNHFTLSQTDFIGMATRLAGPSYSAELIGKTTIEGKEAYVAKITTSSPNALDPRIAYEHMAYDPKTYAIRYWEAFDGSSQEPFLRYLLKSFEIKQDIPANVFKL
ncbi:hypothetical protein COW36_02555 [bacterium (Candidatus Blackallbacteria) CG17_big_fil_post_rev_8_21_14_2_50_48_46]|uniref:DUF1571 domain-containing protein n=1 Tax=bacterium (Candidatus Blackallbacteria) CG17_big_fil_post_rev_8_21_14_2_50_48_46 TaxID=2014261 RepID=A0A2M7GA43_9BACT|nr:MAG: hypothetical protein COW64_12915 [bacterium (Candidatus Blackallbacteria) CG18_big_fil_WC_8_21_14_2_50_49_26]PIW19009.1 MAG: hypothetical protein COW36_02555 [bacterium (Candidatus Blackallbacteria) CG17_big_fil_post_rev_8_21_14_2_50_48_46]PIW44623.1 MAG: hypothetical protein COW20_23560 [bacterium (Candidatus Blackallbacteria) CG13_big_fil_rev_8_21_14_2_50_49_14]